MKPLTSVTAVVIAVLLNACSTLEPDSRAVDPNEPPCATLQALAPGQRCEVDVASFRIQVDSGLHLAAGEVYRLTVSPGQRWSDWGRAPVDPQVGDPGNRYMRWFQPLLRLPDAPYMAMGVALPGCAVKSATPPCEATVQRLGSEGMELVVRQAGTLGFFANDVPFMNWNNGGTVRVRVERLR